MSSRIRRSFSAKFKADAVLCLLIGQKSQAELCREHELSAALLSQWKEAFVANASAAFASPDQRSDESAKPRQRVHLVSERWRARVVYEPIAKEPRNPIRILARYLMDYNFRSTQKVVISDWHGSNDEILDQMRRDNAG